MIGDGALRGARGMTAAFDTSILPTEARRWSSKDGQNHETYEKAAAANLAALLSGDNANGGGITPALAKIIIDRRIDVIGLLKSIGKRGTIATNAEKHDD